MSEQWRVSRIKSIEQSIVETDSRTVQVQLLDISLKGALIEHPQDLAVQCGDRWKLLFRLGGSDIVLQFGTEVVHCSETLAGVKFVETDLDTMIHLRSLIEARSVNPKQVKHELSFLTDND